MTIAQAWFWLPPLVPILDDAQRRKENWLSGGLGKSPKSLVFRAKLAPRQLKETL
jgi:hypothetical protein